MSNWKTRFGTNLYDAKGNVKQQGDLKTLTPKQRARVVKKERRAAAQGDGASRPSQKEVLRIRRAAGNKRRDEVMAAEGVAMSRNYKPTPGAGTQRAMARLKGIFGKDADELFDVQGRVKSKKPKPPKDDPKGAKTKAKTKAKVESKLIVPPKRNKGRDRE